MANTIYEATSYYPVTLLDDSHQTAAVLMQRLRQNPDMLSTTEHFVAFELSGTNFALVAQWAPSMFSHMFIPVVGKGGTYEWDGVAKVTTVSRNALTMEDEAVIAHGIDRLELALLRCADMASEILPYPPLRVVK